MKKVIILIITLIIIIFVFTKNIPTNQFKLEYEQVKNMRKVNIEKENNFVYKNIEEIVEMMDNEETFVVYFGFPTCPWCRSIIEPLQKVSKDNDTLIYYVDIENLRNKITIDKKGNFITLEEGNSWYLELVKKLDSVLDYYTIIDDFKTKINTGQKRIYAPNIITIEKGIPTKITTGISKKQTKKDQKLTKKMLEESYNMIKEILPKKACQKESIC